MTERKKGAKAGAEQGPQRPDGVVVIAAVDRTGQPNPDSSTAGDAPGTLSAADLNDLNSILAPATRRAARFDALWSVWSNDGDYVAAMAAGLAAAACRAAVQKIHAAWLAIRNATLEVEGIDRPFVPAGSHEYVREGETSAQALDRLVDQIEETATETLATAHKTLRILRDRSVRERVRRIRACSEWSEPKGILHNHPPVACVILFRKLLVAPPVYMEVVDDLKEISKFRRQAIAFRQKVLDHELKLQVLESKRGGASAPRPTLSGLSHEQSRQFHDLLEVICAGDLRARHGHKDSERVSTIRLIAEHFRSYLGLSKAAATDLFGVEPWSSGIANLAHAALYYQVTTEDVRGALKNWASD